MPSRTAGMSGAGRFGSATNTMKNPMASAPRKIGAARSFDRSNHDGMTRPSPNVMSAAAGTRYTYWRVPRAHAAPKARRGGRKRYALAFGTPTACSKNGTPTEMSTAPPRTPRRGIPCMVGGSVRAGLRRKCSRRELSRGVALKRLGVLESAAGVEHNDALTVFDPAIASQPRDTRERGASLWTHEHPLVFAGEPHVLRDVVLAHGDGDAARFAQRAQHEEIAERL